MKTDITELAQSMSIERIKQIALGGTPTVGEKERLAITALYFHHELKICTKAFQTAGLNQLAAEEALEKSQRANAAQDDHINQQQDRIAELEESNAQLVQSREHYKRMCEEGLKQLAESRTVTVRMPGLYQTSCSESEKYLCPVDVEQAVLSAGADAGIKIDIKWEDE